MYPSLKPAYAFYVLYPGRLVKLFQRGGACEKAQGGKFPYIPPLLRTWKL